MKVYQFMVTQKSRLVVDSFFILDLSVQKAYLSLSVSITDVIAVELPSKLNFVSLCCLFIALIASIKISFGQVRPFGAFITDDASRHSRISVDENRLSSGIYQVLFLSKIKTQSSSLKKILPKSRRKPLKLLKLSQKSENLRI